MNSTMHHRRQQLAVRIMSIDEERFLDQIDEMLATIEMQARVDGALTELESGQGIELDLHRSRAQAWLRDNATVKE